MIEVLKWLLMTAAIFFTSIGFFGVFNLGEFEERQTLGFIFCIIFVIGSMVCYFLQEIQLELTTMRKQGEKL